MPDGPMISTETTEKANTSPVNENQIVGIARVIRKKLSQLFTEPNMGYHMDQANQKKAGLDLEFIINPDLKVTTTERKDKKRKVLWLGDKDERLIKEILTQNPNLVGDIPLWLNDQAQEEILQQLELIKQSRFLDKKVPKLLKTIRKETILSYLDLRKARDEHASPEKKKRLEEMFRRQRELLRAIRSPEWTNPSEKLKQQLSQSIEHFNQDANSLDVPLDEDGFPKNRSEDNVMRWISAKIDRENSQIYANALKKLEERYPTSKPTKDTPTMPGGKR